MVALFTACNLSVPVAADPASGERRTAFCSVRRSSVRLSRRWLARQRGASIDASVNGRAIAALARQYAQASATAQQVREDAAPSALDAFLTRARCLRV